MALHINHHIPVACCWPTRVVIPTGARCTGGFTRVDRSTAQGAAVEIERDVLCQRGQERVLCQGEVQSVPTALCSPVFSRVFF